MIEQSIIGYYFNVISASLTCLGCLWLFYKYCQLKHKNVGFSMIFILSVSDFILGILMLFSRLFYNTGPQLYFLDNVMYFLVFFSLYWASAMAFLVYRSLKDQDYTSQRMITRTVILVLFTALITSL